MVRLFTRPVFSVRLPLARVGGLGSRGVLPCAYLKDSVFIVHGVGCHSPPMVLRLPPGRIGFVSYQRYLVSSRPECRRDGFGSVCPARNAAGIGFVRGKLLSIFEYTLRPVINCLVDDVVIISTVWLIVKRVKAIKYKKNTMSENVYFFGRSPGVYRKKPRRVHGMPYGAAYVPRMECGRGFLFGVVGGACMASDVYGDRITGLMVSGGLRGFYGACTVRGGCLVSTWHDVGRVPYAIRGGCLKMPPGF